MRNSAIKQLLSHTWHLSISEVSNCIGSDAGVDHRGAVSVPFGWLSNEARELAEKYIHEKVVGKTSRADGQPSAMATVYKKYPEFPDEKNAFVDYVTQNVDIPQKMNQPQTGFFIGTPNDQRMAETLFIPDQASREEMYRSLLPQIQSLVSDEPDVVANLANVAAALREAFAFLWIGFYKVEGKELVLGPFQGPVACTRIAHGKGVCGQAWAHHQTIIVPDVDKFPGHIACSSASRSEIVVPIAKNGEVVMVLDIDSDQLHDFTKVDERYLNELARMIEQTILA